MTTNRQAATSQNLVERLDDISRRMDAAYANRREVAKRHKPGSAEYVAADDAIDAAYQDLRALTAEIGALR